MVTAMECPGGYKGERVVCTSEKCSSGIVCSIKGELNFGQSLSEMGQWLVEMLELTSTNLVLNLTEVDYLDSEGIKLFLALAKRQEEAGKSVSLVIPKQSNHLRLLQMLGLMDFFPIYEQLPIAGQKPGPP